MSARAWQARRGRRDHPPLLVVMDDGTDRARVLRSRRVEWARARRLEQVARRRARRQARQVRPDYARMTEATDAWARNLREFAHALEFSGTAAEKLARSFFGLRPIEDTKPL